MLFPFNYPDATPKFQTNQIKRLFMLSVKNQSEHKKADSPAVLLVKSRTPHRSFLFLLEEKNRRAQIKKCEENFFAGWRGFRATAGLASIILDSLRNTFELCPTDTAKGG